MRSLTKLAAVCSAVLAAGVLGAATAQQPPPAGSGRGANPAPPPACGGRSSNPRTACQNDVDAMMKALPATAQARPQRPRTILVLAATRGWVHSSIPLAAKMVEELGKKTGAWTATTTYDASAITAENL